MTIDEAVACAADVPGYMDPAELRWLYLTAAALTPPAAWCEVGAWLGRSATATAGGLPSGSALCLVDNFTGPTRREEPDVDTCERLLGGAILAMEARAPGLNVRLYQDSSPAAAWHFPDQSFDVIFLDGDHTYPAVCADIRSWTPTLKQGGLFCGHDFTTQCGVAPAVRELLPQFKQVPGTSLWYARDPEGQ